MSHKEAAMREKYSSQIVAYVSPELRKQLEQDRKRLGLRVSFSAYIESVLRQHIAAKREAA